MLYVDLVVEDLLQAAGVQRVVDLHSSRIQVNVVHVKGGSGFIDRNILRYAGAAKHKPFVVVRDLDRVKCAPMMARDLLPNGAPPRFLLCIAVHEVEAWFLADAGQLYNSTMLEYVVNHWRVDRAMGRSSSLERFARKLAALE
jgi:hypothetical protein